MCPQAGIFPWSRPQPHTHGSIGQGGVVSDLVIDDKPFIDVREYGTDGAAVQDAIDAAPVGSIVKLPQGIVPFDTKIACNKKLIIRGHGNPIIVGVQTGTTLLKADTLNDIGLEITAVGAKLEGFLVDGEVGNGNDGIALQAGRIKLKDISVMRMGQDGIRIGTAGADNCNLWYLENIRVAENVRHGLFIDSNNGGGNPDANAGTLNHFDAAENGGDGLKVDNAWLNNFLGVTVQLNTGHGVYFTPNSANNRFFGGDQDEGNIAGNILNEGTGNGFFGMSNSGFVDTGTETYFISRTASRVSKMGFGGHPSVHRETFLNTGGGISVVDIVRGSGNTGANRGVRRVIYLPDTADAKEAVHETFARAAANESTYYTLSLMKEGVAIRDVLRIIADGKTLIQEGGLGIPNALGGDVTETAKTKKVQIFDEDGNNEGYMQLYSG